MGVLSAQHGPVGFEVRKIIEVDAGNGIEPHVFGDGAFGHMAHVVILVPELEGDEGVEAARFILQLP